VEIERHRGLIRAALVYLAAAFGLVAVWILIAPKGFYENFPGGAAEWVSVLPPYNEHLERDYGAAGLGLAVLAGLAAVWMDRRVIQAAAITMFVGSVPHLAYHVTTTERLSTADNVGSLTGLALYALLSLALLYLVSDRVQRAPSGPPSTRVKATSVETP
jgi:hypothetical protein